MAQDEIQDRSGSFFEKWAESEGIPVIRGYYVASLYEVPLRPWERKGGLGALIILEGAEGFGSAYVCEIPPGSSLKPQKQLFEERIFILQGRGETRFWNNGVPIQTVSWQENSLFSPPINVLHQHVNTGSEPAKYVAVTNAPLIFNTFRNEKFVFDSDFAFEERYSGAPDYFTSPGIMTAKRTWKGNFIPDVRHLALPGTDVSYGEGFGLIQLNIAGNSTGSHVAQIQPGIYKKAHRHGAGAHLVIVEGTGYAVLWKEWKERIKVDFQRGTIYCPPEGWWHTHCNTGNQTVKQIALRCGIGGVGKIYRQRLGTREGGDMLEWEDEESEFRKIFEEELAKQGLKSNMPPMAQ